MLVLSRKPGESVIIDGRIRVKIVRCEGDVVKIGIDAPPDIPVHRQEVYDEIQLNNKGAIHTSRPAAPKLNRHESKPTISDRAPLATAGLAA